MRHFFHVSLLLLILFANAGCDEQSGQGFFPTPQPPLIESPQPTAGERVISEAPEEILRKAQNWLAKELDVSPRNVQVVNALASEWPNSCLGLPQPNEMCAEVIIPGWQFTFQVKKDLYEVRSDQEGQIFRYQPAGVVSNQPPIGPTVRPPSTPFLPQKTPLRGDTLENTQWRLISMGRVGAVQWIPTEINITLEFGAGGQVSGSSGCNTFSGSYQVEGQRLMFGALATTLMACADSRLMDLEAAYLAALQSAETYDLQVNQLVILYDQGQSQLIFVLGP